MGVRHQPELEVELVDPARVGRVRDASHALDLQNVERVAPTGVAEQEVDVGAERLARVGDPECSLKAGAPGGEDVGEKVLRQVPAGESQKCLGTVHGGLPLIENNLAGAVPYVGRADVEAAVAERERGGPVQLPDRRVEKDLEAHLRLSPLRV
jgi:hypothetical protein